MTLTCRIGTMGLAVVVVALLGCGGAEKAPAATIADQSEPVWRSLPANTVLAMQVVDTAGWSEALRENRAFGRVMFAPDRLREMEAAIAPVLDGITGEVGALQQGEEALRQQDLLAVLGSTLGMAVLLERADSPHPAPIVLLWSEPGEEAARRIFDAVDALGELSEVAPPPRGGRSVEHERSTREGVDFQEWTFTRRHQLEPGGEVQPLDRHGLVLVRDGQRLLIAGTPRSVSSQVRRAHAAGEAVDEAALDRLSGTGELMPVLQKLVTRIAEDEAGGFMQRLEEVPGMAESMPAGRVTVQSFVDPPPLARLVSSLVPDQWGEGGHPGNVMRQAGLDNIGPSMLTATMDGTVDNIHAFVSMPEPRRGLLALIESTGAEPAPPGWVSDGVNGYSRSHLDFGNTWNVVKELVTAVGGDAGAIQLDEMRQQVRALAGVDVGTLMEALGGEFHHLSWPAELRRDERAAERGQPAALYRNREAIVVPLEDPEPWREVVNALAMAFGQVDEVPADGFEGALIHEPAFAYEPTVRLYVGHDKLVLSAGPDVAESLLPALAEGRAASPLADSERLVQLRERLDLGPAVTLGYTRLDGRVPADLANIGRAVQPLILSLKAGFAQAMGTLGGVEQQQPNLFTIMVDLYATLPEFEKVAPLGGPTIEQAVVTPEGLRIEHVRLWKSAEE